MQPKISFSMWSVGRIQSSCLEIRLFICEQARGETVFMEDLLGAWGVSVEAFQRSG